MHVAQNWRLNAQRYAMKGVRCDKCQSVLFPPREVCPHCAALEAAAAVVTAQANLIALPDLREIVLQRAGR
jgi:uncharacterized OB-fold protein